MRDVYLWTAYALGTVAVGSCLVALYRRYTDWSDRRSYVPPTIHTDVWLPPLEVTEEQFMAPTTGESALVHAARSAARHAAADYASLAEFAGRSHATVAPIWAEIHGRRHVQGLAVV